MIRLGIFAELAALDRQQKVLTQGSAILGYAWKTLEWAANGRCIRLAVEYRGNAVRVERPAGRMRRRRAHGDQHERETDKR
jgi:hypothetical protein